MVFLITFVGGWIRLANLENNPRGLYVDEASHAVNAWSILETGKDEYGKSFPYAFRFFGSYTPPLYTYFTAVSERYLGFTIFATRAVSALAGILLIPIFFVFLELLGFRNLKVKLLATLILALAPWSVFYSRIGYEINLAFLLFTLGGLFLWLAIKNRWYLLPAFGFLALSGETYHSERLLAPLLVVCFLLAFRMILLKKSNIGIITLAGLIYLLISLPQILILQTPAFTARGFGLFYSDAISHQASQIGLPYLLGWLISFSREFLSQYFAYLSPRNLFFQPDSDFQRSLPNLSVFYSWMVILYLGGIFHLIKEKTKLSSKFILLLLLLCPIPASLAGDPFSTQRSLPLLLPLMFIFTAGLEFFISKRYYLWILIICAVMFSTASLYHSLAVLLPNERAVTWGYGFKELASEINARPNQHFTIDDGRIKPAYIELAFYLKISPKVLQQSADSNIEPNYYHFTKWNSHYQINNFETRAINWKEDVYKEQILVGDSLSFSETQIQEHFLEKTFEVKDLLGQTIFIGFKTNPELKCKKSSSELCKTI